VAIPMLNLRCSIIHADVVMTTTRCFLRFDGRCGIHRRMFRLLADQGRVIDRWHDDSSKTVGSGEQGAKLGSGDSRALVAFLYLNMKGLSAARGLI